MKKLLLSLLLGVVLLAAGCKKDNPIPVQSIAIADAPATAGLGQPVKLSVKTSPENADVPFTLEWTVDKTLADFDEATQTLTRKANGPVTVTVSVKGRPEVKQSITINPIIAQSVAFKTRFVDAEVGKPVKVELEVTPTGADTDFTWTLSKNIGTFDEASKTLTLNQPGLVELTASVKGNPDIKDVCAVKDASIVYIPDVTFRKILLSKFDANNDGEIQKSEAESAKIISTSKEKIYSLEGVEYFTNLEKLYCETPKEIANLNLSKNTKLHLLYLAKVKSLDISKNNELDTLMLVGNQLPSIDLSKKTKLIVFQSTENNFTSLDVSQNTKLRNLKCTLSKLATIDVSNNKELVELNLESNQLSSINISQNTKLKVLNCINNQLASIDVSKNVNLTSLDCNNNNLSAIYLGNNTNLRNLYCSGNKLSAIDISNCTNLLDFQCNNNSLSAIDISKNLELTEFYCSNNMLSTIDGSKNTEINWLRCDNNKLVSIDLSNSIHLCTLVCKNNNLTSIDVSKNLFLRNLDCSQNKLTTIDISNNKQYLGIPNPSNGMPCVNVIFTGNPNLTKIYVWKGFTPAANFTKDATTSYVEVP
ncbi:hypothetical protein [uncultured Acetobacteroides sp.]|uniref:leucine-rich repeat domain-containing protein n=1 Tax=uncultured Acetobacteroides sp. TaxID=1760811 RepID=UPI0029F5C810|nr:hypothetical protein [uncultured Acetobacteroides sp.]